MEPQEQIERAQDFLLQSYQEELNKLKHKGEYSLTIDFQKLAQMDPELADSLIEEPEDIIRAFELAIDNLIENKKFKARFTNLPQSQHIAIRNIRSTHINKLMFFEGIVRQSSDVRPQVTSAKFECPSCGNLITILQLEQKFKEPSRCTCGRKGKFRLISKDLVDAQRLVLEESPELLDGGEQPKRLSVFLQEDLVEPKMEKKTTPGSKIQVTGVVKEVPILLRTGAPSTRFDLMMEANSIIPIEETFEELELSEKDEEVINELSKDPNIYMKLTNSIAPSIYGHDKVKEALVLQLMGGTQKKRDDGTKTRGDCHVLLVGDPGAGKSQLLIFISKIAPKARYISGKGASSAGLCVAPESLVLTNPGGISAIKEIVEENLKYHQQQYQEGVWNSCNPKSDKKILTLNNNLKIQPKEISQLWKISPPEEMVKLKTKTGKEIIATPNTRLYLSDLSWKESSELKEGEFIATARNINIEENSEKIFLIGLIKSNPVVLGIKDKVKILIEEACKNKRVTKRTLARALNLSELSIYHSWVNKKARGNIKLNALKKLSDYSGISLKEIIEENTKLSLYNGRPINLPKYANEGLFYFAGLIAGDGDLSKGKNSTTIRFSSDSKELIEQYKNLSQNLFGVKPNISSLKSDKRAESWRFSSKLVFEVLEALGVPSSPKSHRIDMSNILLRARKELLAQYLRGYYDTDGGVVERKSPGSDSIESTSTSRIFSEKLKLVLLRYGIISKLRERKLSINKKIQSKHIKFSIAIRGKENLELFRESIGFNHPEKKQKLVRIINKPQISHSNMNAIPCARALIKEMEKNLGVRILRRRDKSHLSRNYLINLMPKIKQHTHKNVELLNSLAYSDVFWDKIEKIERINKHDYPFVYDLTVEGSHNFIVNGILVHNTAAVVKDEFLKGWALEAGAMVLANGGFCLSGDTKILLSGSRVDTIKTVYERVKAGEKIFVKGLDENNFELQNSLIKKASVRKSEKLYRLVFDTGEELKITGEHPLLKWSNGISWTAVDNLKIGDYIASRKTFPDIEQVLPMKEFLGKDYSFSDKITERIMEFAGLIATDGSLSKKKNTIRFYTAYQEMQDKYSGLAKASFNKYPSVYIDKRSGVKQLFFSSKELCDFLVDMGVIRGNKASMNFDKILSLPNNLIRAFLMGIINGDGSISNRKSDGIIDIICSSNETAESYRGLFRKLGVISRVKSGIKVIKKNGIIKEGTYRAYRLSITGISNIAMLNDSRLVSWKFNSLQKIIKRKDTSIRYPLVNELLSKIRELTPHYEKHCLYNNSLRVSLLSRMRVTREVLTKVLLNLSHLNPVNNSKEYILLRNMAFNEVIMPRIIKKEEIAGEDVYNIEVEGNHNFFANFILVHNCMIDELDKMSQEDTSALHEALEQQRISISKANIQACYSEDTEVLTEVGWKKYDEVKNLKIAQYNVKNKKVKFSRHRGLYVYDFKEEMFHFKNRRIDILVTPNHKMLLKREKSNKFECILAEDISSYRVHFLNSGSYEGAETKSFILPAIKHKQNRKHLKYIQQEKPKKIPFDLWLEFLGYYVTEGGLQRRASFGIPQRKGIKAEKIKKCLLRLSKHIGFKLTETKEGKRYVRFQITNTQLFDYLEKSCGHNHLNKKLPLKFDVLSRRQLKILFDAMMLGDGTSDKRSFTSTSKILIDQFHAIAVLIGKSASMHIHYDEGYRGNRVRAYRVCLSDKTCHEIKRKQVKRVQYEGKVFCFSTKTGFFITRRNGKIAIQGNTLRTETTVLAAANPKLGRFDPYAPIASQIDLPPALINRFDLIFPIRDIPNREIDSRIASHVLKLQQKPMEMHTEIHSELLRKYISYARTRIKPELTDQAIEEIQKFYVELRNKGQAGDEGIKPIPISARQLEALVRLAEGSARVRLSKKVTSLDAKRSIELLKHCLMQVGFDYETGEIDIDRITTGISSSQRSRIVIIREIIRDLEHKHGKSIPIGEIIAAAQDKKIDESHVEESIERLKREGEIFEPRPGQIARL